MSEKSCLICGVSRAEVDATRRSKGYTLGCGVESNTESGFDYEELSPRHRWAPWTDRHLAVWGIKPEAFDKYRESVEMGIRYASCEDTVRGHVRATSGDSELFGFPVGTCIGCGALS